LRWLVEIFPLRDDKGPVVPILEVFKKRSIVTERRPYTLRRYNLAIVSIHYSLSGPELVKEARRKKGVKGED
jgi:hypothetical protein